MEDTKTCTSCGMSVDSVSEDGKCTNCAGDAGSSEGSESSMDTGADTAGESMPAGGTSMPDTGAAEGKEETTDDQG